MRIALVLFVLLSVLLSASSQILLKLGMIRPSMQLALESNGGPLQIAHAIITSPLVLSGMGFFGLSAVVWLFVLAKIPLSTAYPFVALGIAITVIAGRVIFGEAISLTKFVGVALVILGVLTVAKGS
jgi:multidrug transporter EmrE-like cation transporter